MTFGEPDSELLRRVRDGLFLAASRTYAEQYVEPLVRAKYGLLDPESDDLDALDETGHRYEIKACKVLRAHDNKKGDKSLLERVLWEEENSVLERLVPFSEHLSAEYDANVQNVKRDHFDTLVYVLLFEDCAKVFFAPALDIQKGSFKNWSDKHGRYDELGKSGQFAVTRTTISWHLERYLCDTMSYGEIVEIFKRISAQK